MRSTLTFSAHLNCQIKSARASRAYLSLSQVSIASLGLITKITNNIQTNHRYCKGIVQRNPAGACGYIQMMGGYVKKIKEFSEKRERETLNLKPISEYIREEDRGWLLCGER